MQIYPWFHPPKVGCGNSPFSEALHSMGFSRLVSIDNCASVIDRQRVRAPHLSWEVADVRAMGDVADGRFDVILDKGLLDNLYCYCDPEENCQRAVAEFHRVLKPGGILLVLSFHSEEEVFATLTGTSGATPQGWGPRAAVRLRNPRIPEIRLASYTMVVFGKGTDAEHCGAGDACAAARANTATSTAVESSRRDDLGAEAAADETKKVPSDRIERLSNSELLAGLLSPEDGRPLVLNDADLARATEEIRVLELSHGTPLAVRNDGFAEQPPELHAASGVGSPPNVTFAEQLATRKLGLRRAPPLPPPRPLSMDTFP